MSETAALTLFDRIENPIEACEKMGEFIALSGLFGCEKKEQGKVLALACLCERKSPFEILKTYHIIQNRLSMRADAMLARFQELGGTVKWIKFDATGAVASWTYKENQNIEISFTEEDAKRAGFLPGKPGSGWHKHPDAMMRARCVSKAIRMLCPGAVAGTYTPEEIADSEPEAAAVEPERKKYAPRNQAATDPKPVEGRDVTNETKPAEVKPVEQPKAEAKVEPPKTEAPKAEEKKPEPAKDQNPLPSKFEAVAVVIKDKETAVLKYCHEYGLLDKSKKLEQLDDKLMDRILAKPDAFLRAVENGVPPKQK